MIKLNLLPPYVPERPKIRTVIVTFIILLALQGGVVFKFYLDLQAIEKWFPTDSQYYDARKAVIDAEGAKAVEIAGKADAYTTVVGFFNRTAAQEYTTKLATTLTEATAKIGVTQGVWYKDMTIDSTGALKLNNGDIKGLMNFVEYYFKMKDAGFTIQPAAQPYPAPLDQHIALNITGTVSALSAAPIAPGTFSGWADLYKAAGATTPGAEGEAPPAGEAPAGEAPNAPPGEEAAPAN